MARGRRRSRIVDRPRIAAELGLLAGGAIGNIIDRVAFGKVSDFIVWKAGRYEWPTFNVADAALVIGVVTLLLDARAEDTKAAAAPGGESAKRT